MLLSAAMYGTVVTGSDLAFLMILLFSKCYVQFTFICEKQIFDTLLETFLLYRNAKITDTDSNICIHPLPSLY